MDEATRVGATGGQRAERPPDPEGQVVYLDVEERLPQVTPPYPDDVRPPVDLEIVVPAYNEEARLPETLAAIVSYLVGQPYTSAVVVVDNGSIDLTAEIAGLKRGGRVPVYVTGCVEQGKGAAIRRGILGSRARWVGFADADLATPIETLDRMVPLLASGEAVVIGSRRAPGARYATKQSIVRRAGSRAFRALAHRVVPGVHDTQCGFKFFRTDVARRIMSVSRVDGFAFDVELLALAQHFGHRIVEVPVAWSDRTGSTFSALHHGPRAVADMLAVHARLGNVPPARTRVGGRPSTVDLRSAADRRSHDHLGTLAGSRILFVNWRDMRHPQAGGAEVYSWELARRFAAVGADVTFFTSRPPGCLGAEDDDSIHVVRRGGRFTLYPVAAAFLLRHRRKFDAVIDCQNGIPFFVPLFVRRTSAVVCVIHHVHQDQFRVHFPWPMSWIGRVLEARVARLVYGQRALVAVSPSTRAGVRRRLGLRGPIFVVPNGAAPHDESKATRRSPAPTIVSVGRLVAHKRVHMLIEAMPVLLRGRPELRLEIAGDGPERSRLEELASRLGVEHAVRFHGRVSEGQKTQLLRSAWCMANPSMAEGWGIGVIEANSYGKPTVAFRVAGLRDSVRHGVTGWLIDDPSDLAGALERALDELSCVGADERWAARCRSWASGFCWDESARRLAGVVVAELRNRRGLDDRYQRDEHRSDVNCALEFDVACPDAFSYRAAHLLRSTDLWRLQGTHASVLLYGADEEDARRVLERLGVAHGAEIRIATSSDLLVGPGRHDAGPARPSLQGEGGEGGAL